MKVLCLPEPGNLVIKDLPMPELKEGQAIVKMEMCGICGSDVTAYRGVNPTMRYPINGLGHEGVGIIQEIGENDKGLKPGDRVALEPYVPCNKCHMCAAGRFNNCADLHVRGVHKDGMMSEYFLHPVQLLYKLPDELTFTRALIEAARMENVKNLKIMSHGPAASIQIPFPDCICSERRHKHQSHCQHSQYLCPIPAHSQRKNTAEAVSRHNPFNP